MSPDEQNATVEVAEKITGELDIDEQITQRNRRKGV